ncbi:hypothetical protein BDN71DRAFT_1492156 [Pleurotus eryngii]|uniref:Uncharacterized protein n=1 Tax=Pleurotus eryngii TaxID=5323 RepID=A0A9P6AAP9_PLEER|nr:hypothetical protein BDN71DRAFT_1492156 [Pleurotus eryngii]
MIPLFAIPALLFTTLATAQSQDQSLFDDNHFSVIMSTAEWSSRYADWHSRATPHPNPTSFEPTRSALSLAVLRNDPVHPEGFTLALFNGATDAIAVDAMGRVLQVSAEDYKGITSLAYEVLVLPSTGTFRNTWALKRPATSQPIDRILVAVKGGGDPEGGVELKETSVQGFSKQLTMELKRPLTDEGITHLPSSLSELAGLVLEAREGFVPGDEDRQMVTKVKDVLGDVD